MRYFLTLVIFISTIGHAETLCAGELQAGGPEVIAYLNALVEERILTSAELAVIAVAIDRGGSVENPLRRSSETSHRIHARELDAYLDSANLDRAALKKWIGEKLSAGDQIQNERRQVAEEIRARKIRFIPIEPSAEHDYAFEVMDTLLTQKMWVEIMGHNPSRFKGRDKEDHPVESISWWSAVVFANRLSEKMDYLPAYDLSGIDFEGTAEEGTLGIPEADERPDVRVNAKDGDVLFAQGFRLPSYAEMDVLVKMTKYNPADAQTYDWFDENSGGQSHPVADLRAREGLSEPIFDLNGNVATFLWDWRVDIENRLRGVLSSPGSWRSSQSSALSRGGLNRLSSARSDSTGLRLVRTVQ